jgi:curli biogenesis system outer membrane secretion channel CsgG
MAAQASEAAHQMPMICTSRLRLYVAAAVLIVLSGCAAVGRQQMPGEDAVVVGPPVRQNHTPTDHGLACLGRSIQHHRMPALAVSVGDVKDYTGKYSQLEGNAITQGGAQMVYSALGKLGGAITLHERFDTRIAELELAYADRRQLGDGRRHIVEQGKPPVPWMPYFGGSIMRSQYYIVGGITEANYNISSGGTELDVSGVGFKARKFTMNVGVDLRIVDTSSLQVIRTSSLQKQIIGIEVGANVYRFFGSQLLNFNVGDKSQEPLQFGVRTTIEHAVLELLGAVNQLDPGPCIKLAIDASARTQANVIAPRLVPITIQDEMAAQTSRQQATTPQQAIGPAVGGSAGPQNASAPPVGDTLQIQFEVSSTAISGAAQGVIDKLAADAMQGGTALVHLIVRETENWPPPQRRELAERRIKAVTDALSVRGIEARRVSQVWVVSPTDPAITRHSPGYQRIATLDVTR